jgi:antitoxin (DNA-binding transcriptional repressor) of toxin-antitoxin stability system
LAYLSLNGYLVSGCKLVSVEEAREKLPELIGLVEHGELITITRDEIPVADLMPSKAEKSGLDPRSEV